MRSGYLKGLISGYGFAGFNIIAQIVLVPLYLRYLGKAQFGVLMILIGYANYAGAGVNWLTGGLLRAFGRYHAAGDADSFSHAFHLGRYIYVGYAILYGGILLALTSINPGILFGHAQGGSGVLLWFSVCAAAVYVVMFYILTIDRVALTAIGMQHWAYILQMEVLLIYAIGAIVLLNIGTNVAELMVAMAIGAVIAILCARYIWSRQSFAPTRSVKWNAGQVKTLMSQFIGRQGAGYMIFGAIVLTMQADVIFLGWLGSAKVAAEYVVLWKAAEVSVLMLWRIPETLIPDLIQADVSGDKKRLSMSYWSTWRWTLGLSALGGVAYALFGKTVVGLWLGHDAIPDAPYAFVLAGIALFFLGATRPAVTYAYATCRFRPLLSIAGLEMTVKLTILYFTYPLLGYVAPLVGLIVADLAGVYWLYGTLAPKRLR